MMPFKQFVAPARASLERGIQNSATGGAASTMSTASTDSRSATNERKRELSDQDQTRLAMAAFFAALVRSLHDQGKCNLDRFDEEIERLHFEMGQEESPPLLARRTLR